MLRFFSGQQGNRENLATLPIWTPSDKGRFIYVEDVNKFYAGTNSGWLDLTAKSEQFLNLPTWAPEYEGRIVYITSTGKYWGGTNINWFEFGSGGGSGSSVDILATQIFS